MVSNININRINREDENASQRKITAFITMILVHLALFFSLYKFGFDITYPLPETKGIQIAIEFERPRVQGVSRRNPLQKPITNPPIVNVPGNTAPASARVSTSNQSTKPTPQPEAKPSELSDKGDIPVEAPEPKINNKALFQSVSEGEVDANNPNPVDDKSLFNGVGREDEATRTANTPIGPDHRQTVTHNLSGRSVVGGFPVPAYTSQNQGRVVVEVTVNQDGKVTKATAIGKGSTVTDTKLWRAAEEAALKARFDVKKDAPISQLGTITYVFRLS
jgi:TonB family protein